MFSPGVAAARDLWETCTTSQSNVALQWLACSALLVLVTLFLEANFFLHSQIYPDSPLVASILLGERSRISAEFVPPGRLGVGGHPK